MKAHGVKVLVIGGGGRETALARALAHSRRVDAVLVSPGNGGTDGVSYSGTPIDALAPADSVAGWVQLARQQQIDLVVVGPEAWLVAGIADAMAEAGIPCFGPRAAAARLEGSKAFARDFMAQTGIPHAAGAHFDALGEALGWIDAHPGPVVVKASGLAAGKGAVVCADSEEARQTVRAMLEEGRFGAAGSTVVLEERLTGPEVSVLAFSDGRTVCMMPPAQDHKQVFDGDQGPNTGGMGAYAPATVLDAQALERVRAEILQPTIDGMAAAGTPYIGVLYAGLMLAAPPMLGMAPDVRVLEFNCRFGDPEAQPLLALLDSDLMDIIEACLEGTLCEVEPRWTDGAAAAVVACSGGYPGSYEKGLPIEGVDHAEQLGGVDVILAGARRAAGALFTNGGRVLSVTATGRDLDQALERAYAGMERVGFAGLHCRRDIGRRGQALLPVVTSASTAVTSASPAVTAQRARGTRAGPEGSSASTFSRAVGPLRGDATPSAYAAAGVDLEAGGRAVELLKDSVAATQGPEVLAGVGSFGGLFDIGNLPEQAGPVLVASTDGVGTKTRLGVKLNRVAGLGHDIVNHCVNDILVQGARPLFFLDYVAMSQLIPEQVADLVGGAAAACRAAGCALLGGETAEMPGVYQPGELDIVGTIVGVVERGSIIDGAGIQPGDVVLGLASSGLHTNGYSLARRLVEDEDLESARDELGGGSLADALLVPHRSYLAEVRALRAAGVDIRGLAHITGGGLIDNPPRILPEGVALALDWRSWPVPPIFRWMQRKGAVDSTEMARVFNLGLGMLVVLPAAQRERAEQVLEGMVAYWRVGRIEPRSGAPVVFEGTPDWSL